MRLLMSIAVAGLALSQSACSETFASDDGRVEVRLESAGLVVKNETALRVFYYPVERVTSETLLYIWAPCNDPERCPGVAPGASVTIPYSQIFGWQPDSREVLFYYWHLVARQGDFEPDAIRSITASR